MRRLSGIINLLKGIKVKLFKNLKISTRLILFFLILSIVPLLVIGLYTYINAEETIVEKASHYSKQLLDQTVVNVNNKLNELERSTKTVYTDMDLMNLLDKKEYKNSIERLDDNRIINDSLSEIRQVNTDIRGIIIYRPDVSNYTTGFTDLTFYQDAEAFENGPLYRKVQDSKGKLVWVTGIDEENDYIFMMRNLTHPLTLSQIGILIYVVEKSVINDIYSNIDLGQGANYYILDDKQEIILSSNDELLGIVYSDSFNSNFINEKKSSYFTNENNLIVYSTTNNDWKAVVHIPKNTLISEILRVRDNTIIIATIIILLAILFSYLISLSISRPLQKLRRLMKGVEEGDLTLKAVIEGKNEMGLLSNSFNIMVKNIRGLVQGSKKISKLVKDNSDTVNQVASQSVKSLQEVSSSIERITESNTKQAKDAQNSNRTMEQLSNRIFKITEDVESVRMIVDKINMTSNDAVKLVKEMKVKTEKTSKKSHLIKKDIENLNKKARDIVQIVDVIENISEQTDLLSLNASIEAARAGEAGKGFSVVAEEIRKLAAQTNESIYTISEIVNQIIQATEKTKSEIDNADKLYQEQESSVHAADNSFKNIMISVEDIVKEIESLNEVIKDVNSFKEVVKEDIMEMAAEAQDSAASTEEVMAVTEEQVAYSEKLNDITIQLDSAVGKLNKSLDIFKINTK